MSLRRGSRVIYTGTLDGLCGCKGKISRILYDAGLAVVKFDRDGRDRVVNRVNINPEKEPKMKNFKTIVAETIAMLVKPASGDAEKEKAVRALGVAAELCRLGEKLKNDAKKQLADLGIIASGSYTPGSLLVFDSARYTVTAVTSTPSTRLSAAALAKALARENLSAAAQRRIIAGAEEQNKPATSFKVEAK